MTQGTLVFYSLFKISTYLFTYVLGLCWVFAAARAVSSLVSRGYCAVLGFSLRWLLLLRSTGSRARVLHGLQRSGFRSRDAQAREHRLNSSGVRAQLCPTLWDPKDCSLSDSSIHGIFQARILEWVAVSFSRGSSWPRDQTHVSCTSCRGILYPCTTW